jgi:hypothetical protein
MHVVPLRDRQASTGLVGCLSYPQSPTLAHRRRAAPTVFESAPAWPDIPSAPRLRHVRRNSAVKYLATRRGFQDVPLRVREQAFEAPSIIRIVIDQQQAPSQRLPMEPAPTVPEPSGKLPRRRSGEHGHILSNSRDRPQTARQVNRPGHHDHPLVSRETHSPPEGMLRLFDQLSGRRVFSDERIAGRVANLVDVERLCHPGHRAGVHQ